MRTAEAAKLMQTKGVVRLKPEDANLGALKRLARYAAEHEEELILDFGHDVQPERIVKLLKWANDQFRVEAIIKHVELKDYVVHAAVGAGAGAALVVAAKLAGWVVSWPVALTTIALTTIIGIGATPLHIKVYKVKGRTRIRLAPNAR